ncbi:MAG: FecCD family ABC transporter permease, partial [Bacilli bacterium]
SFVLLFLTVKPLKLLALGEEVATLVGMRVSRQRLFLIMLSSLLAAISVSLAGLVGFVGLIIPHIVRMIVRNDERYMLLLSGILGAALVVVSDTVARTVFLPIEIPVGILLSFIGGPFFFYLIWRGRKSSNLS